MEKALEQVLAVEQALALEVEPGPGVVLVLGQAQAEVQGQAEVQVVVLVAWELDAVEVVVEEPVLEAQGLEPEQLALELEYDVVLVPGQGQAAAVVLEQEPVEAAVSLAEQRSLCRSAEAFAGFWLEHCVLTEQRGL